MARPGGKAETRKKEILESFYGVIAEEGLEGASIAKVAGRAGINPSLVIHYFSSKEKMIDALVEYILVLYENTFLPRLREIDDPAEKMRAATDMLFGADWAKLVDNGVFYACYSLSFRNPGVRRSFRRLYEKLEEIVAGELEAMMEAGLIARGDPEMLSSLIIAFLEGYDFYRGLLDEGEKLEEFSRACKRNVLATLGIKD